MHKKILFFHSKRDFFSFCYQLLYDSSYLFFSFLQLCFLCICTSKQYVFAFATKKWRKRFLTERHTVPHFMCWIPGVVPFNTWLILTCKENNCCYMHKMTSISFKIVENIILSETNCYFVSCLYPIHVVTFTLISNLARLSSSLLNKICRQIWYQRKNDYTDRELACYNSYFLLSLR